MTYMPWEQRKVKDLEDNINHKVDQIMEIETGLGTILERVLDIHKIETEDQQEYPTGLELNLEKIQMIDQMIEQETVEMILTSNPTNIVNIVVGMTILESTVWEM